jgi:uncharacterized protein YacL
MKLKQIIRLFIPLILLVTVGVIYGIMEGHWVTYLAVGAGFGLLVVIMDRIITRTKFDIVYSLLGGIAGFYLGTITDEMLKELLMNNYVNLKLFLQVTFSYIGFLGPIFVQGFKPFYIPSVQYVMQEGDEEKQEGDEVSVSPYKRKILDTSVVIDGRIAEIARTGFLDGIVYVPKFVLAEIQMLADSQENLKRNRARRGLDILNELKEIPHINLKIITKDYDNIHKTDEKLLKLAKDINGAIVTNDYNLNKVAKIEGIEILNINDLAMALRQIYLPGEKIKIHILKEGKEKNQGIGYLPDGTMVVLEDGREYMNKEVSVKVTSILQTSSGRIIFTQVDEDETAEKEKQQTQSKKLKQN